MYNIFCLFVCAIALIAMLILSLYFLCDLLCDGGFLRRKTDNKDISKDDELTMFYENSDYEGEVYEVSKIAAGDWLLSKDYESRF